jgi:hypothetical protein
LRTVGGRFDLRVTSGATFLALTFAGLAALGLVPEILVGEKLLFARCEYEISAAIDALEYPILKLWHLPGSYFPFGTALPRESLLTRPIKAVGLLFEIPATLLPVPLPGQSLLDPLPFPRFQVEGMFLHFFDDVLLLDFSLEPAEGIL